MPRRAHAMPFGAAVCEDKSVAFRLWAPAAQTVALRLQNNGGKPTLISLHADAGGWYELVTDAARPGDLYQYLINGERAVPDPASRFQPQDVHGPSEIIDPAAFAWQDTDWRGRPWHEAVLYELHVGTFTPEETYAGAAKRLDYLADLGITAVELMPLSESPGRHNWGYDGVLPFAPERRYGRPEELKDFIQAAHRRGLMVFVDVVYNHFGPEGNYLHLYAPSFFTERHQTPWGAAINFDGADSRPVRDYFIHNALYWIEEFHIDGLRLDAVHAIHDDSVPDILDELAQAVRQAVPADRHVHLVLENDDNAARYLEREAAGTARRYDAQWNDDIHHVLHLLATGETTGYYADYRAAPHAQLGRALAQGFAYQGEPSVHRGGQSRGEPSAHLPPTAFVSFLQNHDQVGNRARGERIGALAPDAAIRAATSIVLLAPSIPLLFMGEEWSAPNPFLFFCDFGPELADAVREGRRREFARFPEFADAAARAGIPDPLAQATFDQARLDWSCLERAPHRAWLEFVQKLLDLRRHDIVPHLVGMRGDAAEYQMHGPNAVEVRWRMGDGSLLQAIIAMSAIAAPVTVERRGRPLFTTADAGGARPTLRELPPWFASWSLEERR
jgi:maltooligosyltrehalose trehalohydrolase